MGKLNKLFLNLSDYRRGRSPLSPNSPHGFTLTELLVVVIIGSIIVSALLSLVVELVGTEQRESSRTETQREMQLSLDYIASDVRQAVYIYDDSAHPEDPTSQPSYKNFLPTNLKTGIDNGTYRPALAFWKPKPLDPPSAAVCAGFGATDPKKKECDNLRLQRRAYSFVAYFEVPNNNATNPNGIWKGNSRIVRYELEKYSNINTLTRNAGYVDPAELGDFVSWPIQVSGTNKDNCQDSNKCPNINGSFPPADAGIPSTLVDFVDTSTQERKTNGFAERSDCPGYKDNSRPQDNDYLMTPVKGTNPNPSFFVCIRNTREIDPNDTATPPRERIGNPRTGEVQDVIVYLRGNAKGRGGVQSDSFLPTMETQISMRGVIDRTR